MENIPFIFTVKHVDAEGKYLRIWACTDEKLYKSVQSILSELRDKFDYMNPLTPATARPHTRCLARNMNGQLLRAQILNSRPDGMILVQFVDYGNFSYVPLNTIRLSNGFPEAEFVLNMAEAATPFIIADLAPIGGIWVDEIVDRIRSILCKNKFQGIYYNLNNRRAIKFTVNGEDFSRSLVHRNMALARYYMQPRINKLSFNERIC